MYQLLYLIIPLSLLGHHAPKHLLRCENPKTSYVTCPETGRHSIMIPLDSPQGKVKAHQILDDVKPSQVHVSFCNNEKYPELNLLIN